MSDFDSADCLERYFSLVDEHPDRFENPPGEIYEILLDPPRIDRARREALDRRRAEGLPADDTRVGVIAVDPYLPSFATPCGSPTAATACITACCF